MLDSSDILFVVMIATVIYVALRQTKPAPKSKVEYRYVAVIQDGGGNNIHQLAMTYELEPAVMAAQCVHLSSGERVVVRTLKGRPDRLRTVHDFFYVRYARAARPALRYLPL